MQSIIYAALTMVVLGSGFAIILLIASIKLKVTVDPKIEAVHAALPNIDCGACGFPGCLQYAKAVVEEPELLGKCAPGGPDVAEAVAGILNIQISGEGELVRPVIHCRAHAPERTFHAKYDGIPLCTAANALPNVQACKFGCMGYGDCTRACKFDALGIIDGLSTVNYDNCTGCGACAKACPRYLIEMQPFGQENMMTVACSSQENGKSTRAFCKVGCIACKLCVKQTDIFAIDDNLARMDYKNYEPSEQTETAMTKCPTGVIVYRGKNAPPDRQAGKKATPTKSA